ncbi:ABC transporter substrate-binding protein [Roseococcus sp. YIM B11640]|uniref:ABC transporter substrate-binding protein n=1 Tax=Roseococcus sp. YIM B11640 TaxID=3133973 RepID=UPI003C79E488
MTLMPGRRAALGLPLALPLMSVAAPAIVRAQSATIRIGVLSDMAGPYAGNTGPGSLAGTRLAAEDFMKAHPDIRVEVLSADAQNKVDVGSQIARSWIDTQGVDAVLDVPMSALALNLIDIMKEKNKVALFTGPASSDLSGRNCSPNHVHWVYDSWSLAHALGTATVQVGGDTWFFLTADYAFGHSLERDTSAFVTAAGGRIVGSVRHPFPGTADFSSFLVQAQASRAKVLGLANAGADAVNSIKQAAEFGLTRRGMRIAAMLTQINDVHALGLESAQGLLVTESFYWDMNDGTRAFAERFARERGGQRPGMIHAGGYSATMHYLKSIASLGAAQGKADGAAVVRRMKEMPTDDPLFGRGTVRADGRKIHSMHLFQVKAPSESRGAWDYFKLLQSVPPEQSFRPMAEGGCPLVRG